MKTIPLREFMLHGSTLVKDLHEPIVLTVRGEPVCAVVPTTATETQHVSTLKTASVNIPDPSVNTQERESVIQAQNRTPCNFCPNRGAWPHKYQYEDGSGEGEAYFCPKCWEKYEKAHRPHVSEITAADIRPVHTGAFEFHGSIPKPIKKKK